jgi:hypothetical protein
MHTFAHAFGASCTTGDSACECMHLRACMFFSHAARHGLYHVGGCKLLPQQLTYSITKNKPLSCICVGCRHGATVVTATKKLQPNAGSAAEASNYGPAISKQSSPSNVCLLLTSATVCSGPYICSSQLLLSTAALEVVAQLSAAQLTFENDMTRSCQTTRVSDEIVGFVTSKTHC